MSDDRPVHHASLTALLFPALETLDRVWAIGGASAILAAAPMIIAIGLAAMNLIRFRRLLRPTLIVVAASANIKLN